MKNTLHIVVHHRNDRSQTFANHWLDDFRLGTITTTEDVATQSQKALALGETVFVHRCAVGAYPPTICCSASVTKVEKFDTKAWLVKFDKQEAIEVEPSYQPMRGQNFYRA